jgi:hypothetical protein
MRTKWIWVIITAFGFVLGAVIGSLFRRYTTEEEPDAPVSWSSIRSQLKNDIVWDSVMSRERLDDDKVNAALFLLNSIQDDSDCKEWKYRKSTNPQNTASELHLIELTTFDASWFDLSRRLFGNRVQGHAVTKDMIKLPRPLWNVLHFTQVPFPLDTRHDYMRFAFYVGDIKQNKHSLIGAAAILYRQRLVSYIHALPRLYPKESVNPFNITVIVQDGTGVGIEKSTTSSSLNNRIIISVTPSQVRSRSFYYQGMKQGVPIDLANFDGRVVSHILAFLAGNIHVTPTFDASELEMILALLPLLQIIDFPKDPDLIQHMMTLASD